MTGRTRGGKSSHRAVDPDKKVFLNMPEVNYQKISSRQMVITVRIIETRLLKFKI